MFCTYTVLFGLFGLPEQNIIDWVHKLFLIVHRLSGLRSSHCKIRSLIGAHFLIPRWCSMVVASHSVQGRALVSYTPHKNTHPASEFSIYMTRLPYTSNSNCISTFKLGSGRKCSSHSSILGCGAFFSSLTHPFVTTTYLKVLSSLDKCRLPKGWTCLLWIKLIVILYQKKKWDKI